MRSSRYGHFCFLVFILCSSVWADYAWIPVKRKLVLRTGADWNKTYENFDSEGFLSELNYSGQRTEVRDFSAYVFAEYGIAEQWSAWTRLQYVGSVAASLVSNADLATGSGLGDTWLGIKRQLATEYPLVTVETFFKFPTGSSTATTTDEMVTGEGNFDWAWRLHFGFREGPVLIALSPSLWIRFGGYSTAAMLEAAIQYNFPYRAYGRLFAEGMLPFSDQALRNSTLDNHNLLGTAGSYLKLAASPTYFAAGARAGINFLPSMGVEGFAALTFQGRRAARNLRFGLNLIFNFDFYQPDYRPKMREVPFDRTESSLGE